MKMTKQGGKIKKGSKIAWGSRFSTRGQVNAVNVDQGIRAEQRILDSIHADYQPKRVTKGKENPDKGKPDIELIINGKKRFVEVKSIAEFLSGGQHGRAQFLRDEIRNLAKNNDLVIFEIRKSEYKKEYYLAKARKVYALIKDEEGEELKVEYSQIVQFQKVNIENPLRLRKIKPSLERRFAKFLGKNKERVFSEESLRRGFSDKEIIELLREPLIYSPSKGYYQSLEAI